MAAPTSSVAAFVRRPWIQRAAIAAAAALALFTLIGFFAAPAIIRRVAERQIAERLGRRASIGRVRVNPFALSLEIDDLQIYEPDGKTSFVGFARFYVNAQLSSIYRRAPVVKEVSLAGLRVHLVRLRQTAGGFGDLEAYNFSDILARVQAAAAKAPPAPPPPPGHEPPRFSINNILLSDGAVVLEDRPTGGRHEIAGLRVGVPFVSTLPIDIDTFVKPELAVTVDGTPFSVAGQTKPFKDSLETSLALRLTDLDLARYQEYVPLPPSLRQVKLASGRLTLALDLSFLRPRAGQPTVTLTGQVGLQQLALRRSSAAAAPLLDLTSLAVKIGRADLSAMRFKIERVALSGLDVHARRLPDGSIDLEHLLSGSAATGGGAGAPAAKSSPTRFEVDDVKLEKIDLHLRDETVRPAFVETIRDLGVEVQHLSNDPGARASVRVRLTAVPGGTVTQTGTLTLEPFAAAGKVTVEGIEPSRFAPYYQDQIAFDVVSGRLRLGTEYRVTTKGRQTTIGLDDAFVELTDLALARRGPSGGRRAADDFFRLESLAVRKVKVDLDGRTVQVGAISSRNARVRAARSEGGVVDLTTLVPSSAPPRTEAAAPAPVVAAAAGGAAPAPAWTVDVGDVDVAGWAARFDDRAVKPKATLSIDGLAVRASALSTRPGNRASFDVKLTLNQTGKIAIAGSAVTEPPTALAANVRVDLRALKLLPFQPYFRDQVNLIVTDGALSLKGQLDVHALPGSTAKHAGGPGPPPKITFAGDLDVADLGTLDGNKNEKLLGWRSLHLGGIAVATEPMTIGVREVKLTDLAAKLVVFPDARFNLQDIAGPPPRQRPAAMAAVAEKPSRPMAKEPARVKSPPTGSAAAPRIEIGRVILQNGAIAFTDRSITPNYATELTGLSGSVGKLSTDPQTTAEVALRGALDHSGALSIEGKINPLTEELLVDLSIKVRDLDLPPASPYAGRFVGYNIEKGKLSLGLDYHIAGGKLDAQNKLTLDQFTFGDKVASKDAVNLPVKLAVALLKDRHGVIDIDMPLSGSLKDPEFKLGRFILKTLGNLIVKAATAPFSLIASAFGGGDEESHVDFPAGRASLSPRAVTKLQGIGKALHERPGLSFEIEGLADPQLDPAGLRPELYERKLRAQKRRLIAESGQTPPPGDALAIDAGERPTLIAAAYGREAFAKPRGPDGKEKALPPVEMEKLILANIRVEPDVLRQLALRRAGAVKEALARSSPDATPRLFLINPRTATPGNRVELKLKAN